jgi:hypothetical protein
LGGRVLFGEPTGLAVSNLRSNVQLGGELH